MKWLQRLALVLLLPIACSDAATTDPSPDAATADSRVTSDTVPPTPDVATDTQPPASPVSYGVGVHYFVMEGPNGRSLPCAVWYPIPEGTTGESFVYVGFIPREAIQGAPIAEGGPWPLVLFSHGNRGVKEQSVFLTEELAKSGYIVAAPDHTGNTFFGNDAATEPITNVLRPQDVSALLDRLESPTEDDPSWFGTHIDHSRVGVSGHSRGGYTALALMGAPLHPRADYTAFCEADPEHETCVAYPLATAPHTFRDERIRGALPMSPASYTLALDQMAGLSEPIFIMTGRLDGITTYDGTVRPIYDALSAPKYLWTLERGNHYTFSDLCQVYDLLPPDSQALFQGACDDEAAIALLDGQELIYPTAIAFFDHLLKDDQAARSTLEPVSTNEVMLLSEPSN